MSNPDDAFALERIFIWIAFLILTTEYRTV